MAVILETSLGDITVDLFTDERPRTCLNFLKLCKIKYYNFSLFYSVQRNAVAQTGDPTGSGRGGHSVFAKLYGEQAAFFDKERKPRLKHRKLGTVSMVNNGQDMHGSQFFITTGEDLDYLDDKHTVFGEVSEGFDVLSTINETFCDRECRPYKDIRIYHTIVLEDPFDDPAGLEVPDRSPEPTKEQLDSGRIRADEDIDDMKGKSNVQVEEMLKEREAKANAQILEMVGDLPDAEVKPEDNVLFVCKLNPVTSGEDLEVIFSRFGKILSCEVIKDQKSGESLQYAFIEFEKPEDCENAYFKMDNVLIDDRRIHVDFSQSVSKVQWKGKSRGLEFTGVSGRSMADKLALKTKRNTGGYDLIFDDDDDESDVKKKNRQKHKKSASRSRSRSRSPRRRRERSPDGRRDDRNGRRGDARIRRRDDDKNRDRDRRTERRQSRDRSSERVRSYRR